MESGIDDLLSLRTAYWEPGLGPRAPRRSGGEYRYDAASAAGAASRGRSGLLEEREDSAANLLLLDTEAEAGPSSPQLDQLMHQAMAAVNNILANLEADKGEQQTATSAAAVLRIISPCAGWSDDSARRISRYNCSARVLHSAHGHTRPSQHFLQLLQRPELSCSQQHLAWAGPRYEAATEPISSSSSHTPTSEYPLSQANGKHSQS